MPTNNFKLFDEKKANMMSDDDYAINQQRLNGVQSGVASSQLQNKTLYQTALMCYALARLMAANGYDANDANAVSTFVNNLSLSMVQKVVDKASANDVANQVAGKWVDAKQLGELKADIADNYLPLLGGTMLGDLLLNRDPVSSLQAATKQYVDKNNHIKLVGSFASTKVNESFNVDLSKVDITKVSCFLLIFNISSDGGGVGDDAAINIIVNSNNIGKIGGALGGCCDGLGIIQRNTFQNTYTKGVSAISFNASFNRNNSFKYDTTGVRSESVLFDNISSLSLNFIGGSESHCYVYALTK